MDLLNDNPVCVLSGDEFSPVEGKGFKTQVDEYFQQIGRNVTTPFGIVTLDMKGIKNDIHHGLGRLKAASFAAVKDVLEKGVIINPLKQYHTNDKNNPTGMIAAPIQIGDEKYVCVVEIISNPKIQRLYVHEVTLTKNLQRAVADTTAVHKDYNPVTQPKGEIAKVLFNHLLNKETERNPLNTSIDANGNVVPASANNYGMDEPIQESNTRKDMKTNRIKLTESQLRNMIAESITEAINELDYKTYINAGKKAGKGGDISTQRELNPNGTPAQWFQDAARNRERAKKFYDKAKEEFNQTHGYKNGRRYDDDYSAVELGGDFTASEEFGPHIRGFKSKGYGEPYKYEYGRRYDGYAGKDMSPEEFFDGNGDASNAFNNAQEEWANFKQGKYDYDNEKGWHLKESQLKNIIGKAVREALHR